jgi:hypothetical protein
VLKVARLKPSITGVCRLTQFPPNQQQQWHCLACCHCTTRKCWPWQGGYAAQHRNASRGHEETSQQQQQQLLHPQLSLPCCGVPCCVCCSCPQRPEEPAEQALEGCSRRDRASAGVLGRHCARVKRPLCLSGAFLTSYLLTYLLTYTARLYRAPRVGANRPKGHQRQLPQCWWAGRPLPQSNGGALCMVSQ